MALIKCKECGKQISDTATSCPHCGYELKKKITKPKKTGAIIILIANSIFLIFFILMLLASLAPTQQNPEYTNSTGGITIGAPQQAETLDKNVQLVVGWIFLICPLVSTILSIIFLLKHKPTKKVYGITSLILSILWSFMVVIYISKVSLGCCYVIFLINPIISIIGSIVTLIELSGEKNNETKTDNK